MRWALLAAAVACSPASAPTAPGGPLVVWNTGNGWTTLTIQRDRTATYDFHPFGPQAAERRPEKRRLVLRRSDVDALARTLAAHDACKIHPTGRDPVPDEDSQSLTLDLPGLSCTVSMLSNDWTSVAATQPVASALDELTERVHREGAH